MFESPEPLTNSKDARKALGIGASMMSAIKKAMGIKCRYFFLSDVQKWMRKNPQFQLRDSYPRK